MITGTRLKISKHFAMRGRSLTKVRGVMRHRYPHDDPRGWVEQDYRPPQVAGRVYYEPSEHGAEAGIGERLRRRRRVGGDDGEDSAR